LWTNVMYVNRLTEQGGIVHKERHSQSDYPLFAYPPHKYYITRQRQAGEKMPTVSCSI
jgi:hypothetical protein